MSKKLKYITMDQYLSLGKMGRELYDYWTKFLPRMSQSLAEKGEFWESLKSEAETLDQVYENWIAAGYEDYEAAEEPRQMMMETPPEPGT